MCHYYFYMLFCLNKPEVKHVSYCRFYNKFPWPQEEKPALTIHPPDRDRPTNMHITGLHTMYNSNIPPLPKKARYDASRMSKNMNLQQLSIDTTLTAAKDQVNSLTIL